VPNTSSKIGCGKSFVDDLTMERGIVRVRVALVPRSAEIQPAFLRFAQHQPPNQHTTTHHINQHTPIQKGRIAGRMVAAVVRLSVCLFVCLSVALCLSVRLFVSFFSFRELVIRDTHTHEQLGTARRSTYKHSTAQGHWLPPFDCDLALFLSPPYGSQLDLLDDREGGGGLTWTSSVGTRLDSARLGVLTGDRLIDGLIL
jgi:hypothetical protein